MDAEMWKLVLTQGIFAVLFVYLFLYMLKDSKEREIKYQTTIDKLTDKIGVVDTIKDDVEEIKNKLEAK